MSKSERKDDHKQRIVSALRSHLGVTCNVVSDDELLQQTKQTLVFQMIQIQIAKEDFAIAVKPVIEKAAQDIRTAFKIKT